MVEYGWVRILLISRKSWQYLAAEWAAITTCPLQQYDFKNYNKTLGQHDHQGRSYSLLASVAEGPARSLTINQTTGNYRSYIEYFKRDWRFPVVVLFGPNHWLNGGRSPKLILAPCHVMCTPQSCTVLIGWDPATPPPPHPIPPALGWALLVSKDKRHLFVTSWPQPSSPVSLRRKATRERERRRER